MGRVATIGLGIWLIGSGLQSWPTIPGVVKIVGGVIVLLSAAGLDF